MDPSYNSPLLRRASAARAPSTGSFYDVTDHIAALTTNDLLCRLTHTGHRTAPEFHRSVETLPPAICARVGALHILLDGSTQKGRARAPSARVSLDLSGDHHAANARDNESSRGIARARPFFTGTGCPPNFELAEHSDSRVYTSRGSYVVTSRLVRRATCCVD